VSDDDLFVYTLQLGDDALVLAQRLAEWCAKAPEIEEDIALANIALDLLGQARNLLSYAGDVEGHGRSEDDLAYRREEHEFRNALLPEQPNGDFASTIIRQLLFSAYQLELYSQLKDSVDETLAGVAGKAVKEVAYHLVHASQWTLRLGDGTGNSHQRAQIALDTLWPFSHELFESNAVAHRLAATNVAVDPTKLLSAWQRRVSGVLTEATLIQPASGWRPRGGRAGRHSEAMGFLLAELQHLHRSHPGVVW
jgi:ring-1,2-phenylacetyl-CoA epoxidase subunit PaaC